MAEEREEQPALIAKGNDGEIYICVAAGEKLREAVEAGMELLIVELDLELDMVDIKDALDSGESTTLTVP